MRIFTNPCILLSIKPNFVELIFRKVKRYEFRKKISKRYNIKEVMIYSTSPIKKVVGSFIIGEITYASPKVLWGKCKDYAGIDEYSFFKYFNEKILGYAIEIKNICEYSIPFDPFKIIPNFHPPQSFYYFNPHNLWGGRLK